MRSDDRRIELAQRLVVRLTGCSAQQGLDQIDCAECVKVRLFDE